MWCERNVVFRKTRLSSLGRILCPFIDPMTQLIMHNSTSAYNVCFPCKTHQWLASDDLEVCRNLEMFTLLETRHVCTSRSFATCASVAKERTNICLSFGLCAFKRRTIARTKPCTVLLDLYPGFGMHHGSDINLACGDRTNLDCYEVMATNVDYNITITTLDNL
jgi:hypothetical protein